MATPLGAYEGRSELTLILEPFSAASFVDMCLAGGREWPRRVVAQEVATPAAMCRSPLASACAFQACIAGTSEKACVLRPESGLDPVL